MKRTMWFLAVLLSLCLVPAWSGEERPDAGRTFEKLGQFSHTFPKPNERGGRSPVSQRFCVNGPGLLRLTHTGLPGMFEVSCTSEPRMGCGSPMPILFRTQSPKEPKPGEQITETLVYQVDRMPCLDVYIFDSLQNSAEQILVEYCADGTLPKLPDPPKGCWVLKSYKQKDVNPANEQANVSVEPMTRTAASNAVYPKGPGVDFGGSANSHHTWSTPPEVLVPHRRYDFRLTATIAAKPNGVMVNGQPVPNGYWSVEARTHVYFPHYWPSQFGLFDGHAYAVHDERGNKNHRFSHERTITMIPVGPAAPDDPNASMTLRIEIFGPGGHGIVDYLYAWDKTAVAPPVDQPPAQPTPGVVTIPQQPGTPGITPGGTVGSTPGGASGGTPAAEGDVIKATTADWSQPGPKYDATEGILRLNVLITKPGTILDTVGLNAAAAGSFSLVAQDDGRLVWNVFAPGAQSPARDASGWHRLASDPLKAGVWHRVEIWYGEIGTQFTVDDKHYPLLELRQPLSGAPVFVGDFPDDKKWEPKVDSKRGFTGEIKDLKFGPVLRR